MSVIVWSGDHAGLFESSPPLVGLRRARRRMVGDKFTLQTSLLASARGRSFVREVCRVTAGAGRPWSQNALFGAVSLPFVCAQAASSLSRRPTAGHVSGAGPGHMLLAGVGSEPYRKDELGAEAVSCVSTSSSSMLSTSSSMRRWFGYLGAMLRRRAYGMRTRFAKGANGVPFSQLAHAAFCLSRKRCASPRASISLTCLLAQLGAFG